MVNDKIIFHFIVLEYSIFYLGFSFSAISNAFLYEEEEEWEEKHS